MFVGGGGREKGTLFVPKYAAFAHCYNSPQSPISFWGKMQKEERVSDGLQYLILVKHWWPMFVPAIISMPYDHTVPYYYSYYHYCPDQISFKIHKSASDLLTLISVNDFCLFFSEFIPFQLDSIPKCKMLERTFILHCIYLQKMHVCCFGRQPSMDKLRQQFSVQVFSNNSFF